MKNNTMIGVYTRNEENIPFNFYTNLSVTDKVKFVNAVSAFLIGDNYYSVIRDIAFDYMVIKIFTDVDTTEIDDSTAMLKSIEDFLEETNIIEIVKANIDEELIEELNKAVNDNIEYRTGIHRNPIGEALGQLLKTLEKKLSNVDFDAISEMAQAINDTSGEFTMEKMLDVYTKSDIFKKNHGQENSDDKDDKVIPMK